MGHIMGHITSATDVGYIWTDLEFNSLAQTTVHFQSNSRPLSVCFQTKRSLSWTLCPVISEH